MWSARKRAAVQVEGMGFVLGTVQVRFGSVTGTCSELTDFGPVTPTSGGGGGTDLPDPRISGAETAPLD